MPRSPLLSIRVSKRIFFWSWNEKKRKGQEGKCKEGKRRRNWDVPIPVALLLIPPRRILGNFQVVVLFTLIQIVALLPLIFSCETKRKRKKKIKHHRLDERREKGKKMRECFRPSVRPSTRRNISITYSTHSRYIFLSLVIYLFIFPSLWEEKFRGIYATLKFINSQNNKIKQVFEF